MLYWVTGAVLLVYLVLVWFFAGWVNPSGSGIWVLRVGLWLIGLLGAGLAVWWLRRQAAAAEGADDASLPAGATTEVDLLVRDAVRKLKSSTMGRGASLKNLPLIFLVGDPASAKTTTIIHSALDPELLAGQVYQDNAVLPTRVANFWYTRQAVFLDGGGSLFSQPDLWKRLVRLVQPGQVVSAGKQQQAPRAAIVCFDCESFFRQGANEATLSAARRLGTRLLEISQLLGISFPIYVLFTKADRIGVRADGGSLFLDYVAGLTKDETSQVFGATLPVRSLQATGVYAEEETKRLEKAFDELFYSLAEKRIDLLAGADQVEKIPGIYEFPRELRKLRPLLVQFLVDLARPSQLNVNPFLRGFYFSGVRPTIIDDVVPAAEVQAPESGFNPNATVIFGASQVRSAQSPAPRMGGSRKVPEWVFLSQFFNEVLLKDRLALSTSGFSSRTSLLRRMALAAVTAIALVFAFGFLISFIGNLSLEHSVKHAVDDVRALRVAQGQTPSVDQLQKLDGLRQELSAISNYRTDGVPLHLRWWMYSGEEVYPAARQVYFDQFSNLLFAETQGRLLNALRNVKEKPDLNDSYEISYNQLKAYLITTSNPDKSTKDFLAPVLYSTWANGKTPDEQTAALARAQFEFYSTELLVGNPYSSSQDAGAVARSRIYLSNFSGIDRYYLPLKADVSRKVPGVSFSRQFRDAGDVVVSPHDVEGAFTPDGFTRMQNAIGQNRIISEEWVLGKLAAQQLDQATLQQQLSDRYYDDFIKEWRTVLQTTVVRSYPNFHEADVMLGKLTSPSSPLLEFFWFVSHNTNVPFPKVADSFQPVQTVVPAGPPDQYILPSNQQYVVALTKLKSQISLLAASPTGMGDTGLVTQALAAVGDANGAVAQMAQKFRVDPQFHIETVTQNLLNQPLDHAQALVKMGPKEALNGGGKAFCGQFAALTSKFPFNQNSSDDLSLDQLNAILAPGTGTLWTTYKDKWAQYLTKQGTRYEPISSGSVKISPEFVGFFNRAAALSDALYSGTPAPHALYSLKLVNTNIDGLTLKVGSQTLAGVGQQKTFTWTGAPEDVMATERDVPVSAPHSGPWAAFHFIYDGHPVGKGASTYDLEFVQQSNGKDIIINGKRRSYTYQLQFPGPSPLAGFTGLTCVSQVAR
ncbi:MAG: ImcF-related family protein [Candidatus Sulfotelmatobacter sp.]